MKPEQTKTEQKGFVAVVVLCMVILMSVLLLGFNHQSRNNLLAVDNFRKSEQAINCARAGFNIAIAAIRDGVDIDTNKDLQNLFSGEKTFALDNGTCSVTINEENSKLNVNHLKNENGQLNRTATDQLLRLIELLNQEDTGRPHIGYGIVPSTIDWTDSDEEVTCLPFVKSENLGAESSYYSGLAVPYKCGNKLLDTVDELLLVKGITPEIYDRICNDITVYGDGKININRASKRIIESLSEKIDPALAQMIIDRRKIKPFESIAELRDIPGMTDGIYYTIKKTAAVSSSEGYYSVVSRGNVDNISCTIAAILQKNTETKNVDVILYKEF